LSPVFEFSNFWQLIIDYFHYYRAFDDANRGIIGLYRRPSGNTINTTIKTDARKPVQFSIFAGVSTYENGSNNYLTMLQSTIRPLSWIELQPSITYMRTLKEEAWVVGYYSPNGHNIFGDRYVDHIDISLRGTVTFAPAISVQFFNQLLFAEWHYTNLREHYFINNFKDLQGFSVPRDFSYKVFNANIVFRWEYLPGSTFYLVWTQNRQVYEGLYEMTHQDDIADIFRIPMDNVILAKISYWWSL
jgi:hypothetical protein